jgi:hypothetical protein
VICVASGKLGGLNLQACRLVLIREVSCAMRRLPWAFSRFACRADGPGEAEPGTGRRARRAG